LLSTACFCLYYYTRQLAKMNSIQVAKIYVQAEVNEIIFDRLEKNPPKIQDEKISDKESVLSEDKLRSILHKQYVDIFIHQKQPELKDEIDEIIFEEHLKYLSKKGLIAPQEEDVSYESKGPEGNDS
jgi:hypothetical protein